VNSSSDSLLRWSVVGLTAAAPWVGHPTPAAPIERAASAVSFTSPREPFAHSTFVVNRRELAAPLQLAALCGALASSGPMWAQLDQLIAKLSVLDLTGLPPLRVTRDDEGAVLAQWFRPTARLTFRLVSDETDSDWTFAAKNGSYAWGGLAGVPIDGAVKLFRT